MSLAASRVGSRAPRCRVLTVGIVALPVIGGGQRCPDRRGLITNVRGHRRTVTVGRDLRDGQSVVFSSRFRAQNPTAKPWSISRMNRNSAAEVWKSKGRPTISPVCCSEQRKQSGILRNGKDLTITIGPRSRCEAEWKHLNLSKKGI
jgi:hypothetical protein